MSETNFFVVVDYFTKQFMIAALVSVLNKWNEKMWMCLTSFMCHLLTSSYIK
jgi:hypothetical protein